jgi:pretoxin HINT domain-containing protein
VTLHEDGHATAQTDTQPKTQQVATKAHGSQAPPSASDSDETIHTTANHPWLTTDRGWVRAGALRVGEQVVALDGHTATIAALAVHPGAATYYNLTVSNVHTFAVGAGKYVVHNNTCFGANNPDQAAARERISYAKRAAQGETAGVWVTDETLRSSIATESSGAAVISPYGPATMYPGGPLGIGGCAEFRCGAEVSQLYQSGALQRGNELYVYLYHSGGSPSCPSCSNMLNRWAADNQAPIHVYWLDNQDRLWGGTWPH